MSISLHPIISRRRLGTVDRAHLNSTVATTGATATDHWLFEVLKDGAIVVFSHRTTDGEIPALPDRLDMGVPLSAVAARVSPTTVHLLRITRVGKPSDLSGAEISCTLHGGEDL